LRCCRRLEQARCAARRTGTECATILVPG
jgi:hypothetical protein